MKKTKKRTKYLLLLLILFISVGYAILQSNLTITGTTSIQDSKWDIHWNNVVITTGSVSTSNADKATIDNTRQLDYYKNLNVTTSNYSGAIKQNSGSNSWWWLRSADSYNAYYFCNVYDIGRWSYGNSDYTSGVSPAFRIG